MPAAAVIPAPIVYIKVVAVKKLVVGFWSRHRRSGVNRELTVRLFCPARRGDHFNGMPRGSGTFTLNKLECLKQADSP